jgi:predicted dehydrogenase/threonine dehydrogenase-like Zn-dependent dehydrogenase
LKQVTQRLKDGRIELRDVPSPTLDPETVLVQVRASLLSAGTERSKVETARASMVGKARARPDQVRQVVEKAKRDGVRETVETVRARLDQPTSLGYSAAGIVLAVGSRVLGIAPGDRVACAGEGAAHAEIACVPGNLCVRMPDGLDWAHGAFSTLGSIALHGVRQADVRLGERVAVIGLGLVGQLCVQLLAAAGCSVIGIDVSADLVERSVSSGAVAHGFQRKDLANPMLPAASTDCDAVIIAASSPTSDPIELAAALCRDRGRVVVIGAVGMTVPRAPFYEKELDLRLSRSYGPGRYDREYEERGLDYPIGYVRWTERRNMESFLDLVARGTVDVDRLISKRIPIDDCEQAYDELVGSSGSPLGIVLQYRSAPVVRDGRPAVAVPSAAMVAATNLGVIGAGSFAQRILIPRFKDAGFSLVAVASHSGLSASAAAERFGFRQVVAPTELIADPDVALVAIATRHSTHADFARLALNAGRAVFVEKPPCLTETELHALREAREAASRPLIVGFNRRHAPLALELREHVGGRHAPIELLFRVNAGHLDPDHWLNDVDEGGGRLLGEGCHFIDFACWLVGAMPESVFCGMPVRRGVALAAAQQFSCTLTFGDGSIATVMYGAEGADRLGKEYVEAHSAGCSAVLDDFRSLTLYDGRRRRVSRSRRQDKGHASQAMQLHELLATSPSTTSECDPLGSMAVTLAALRSAQTGRSVAMDDFDDEIARLGLEGVDKGFDQLDGRSQARLQES